jgi:small basic protein|tara:strand:+ start:231 stop:476 length:246 start_codon:yes stop_codon:yes gene_type:complete
MLLKGCNSEDKVPGLYQPYGPFSILPHHVSSVRYVFQQFYKLSNILLHFIVVFLVFIAVLFLAVGGGHSHYLASILGQQFN